MNQESQVLDPPKTERLDAWKRALDAWSSFGETSEVDTWLTLNLDPDGVPLALPIPEWLPAFRLLQNAIATRPQSWPEAFDARIEGWFRALLRFSRPDGSPTTTATLATPGKTKGGADRALFRAWAERLADPGFPTVVDWWFPPSSPDRHNPPPLPADARPDRPLAVLRANWAKEGDFAVVDHRSAGVETQFELFGRGRTWLGPGWTSPGLFAPKASASPTLWISHSAADLAEWSYPVGKARVTRSVVVFRGRRLALISEQWEGPGDPGVWRIDLPADVVPTPLVGSRTLRLDAPRARFSPRAMPIGLSASTEQATTGRFAREGQGLILQNEPNSGAVRSWRPLLISWDAQRDRRAAVWKPLTVTEDRRVCRADEAFAARISWGRDENLLVYRSLAPPACRTFLGHQTRPTVRFLVGLFSVEGDVEPLLQAHE